MRNKIIVGTCGFPSSRKKIFSLVDAVEIQQSFYNILSDRQIENILKSKPSEKEITIKAWQVITHPSKTPSWRRLKAEPPGRKENYGWLRPTEENIQALKITYEEARKLDAKIIVLQTPPSMPVRDSLKKDIEKFFDKALELLPPDRILSWEPRGEWLSEQRFLEKINSQGIHIITDYLRRPPVFVNKIMYTRLHGLGGTGEVNYKYKYTREDLEKLLTIIMDLFSRGSYKVYVMFNNVYMLDDALAFKELVRG